MGRTSPVIPAYVDLFPTMQHRPYNIPGPGFVGPAHAGAKVENDQINLMRLSQMSQEEFTGRRQLLESIDQLRRSVDGQPMERMDISYRQAFEVLTSNRLVDALDLTKESRAVRDRYGYGSPRHQGDGAPLWNDQLLMARRLVETGVRCVTVCVRPGNARQQLPLAPQQSAGVRHGVSLTMTSINAAWIVMCGVPRGVSLPHAASITRRRIISAAVNTCLMAGGRHADGLMTGNAHWRCVHATRQGTIAHMWRLDLGHTGMASPHLRDSFDRLTRFDGRLLRPRQ